jgi:diaminopimelate decarboxylase
VDNKNVFKLYDYEYVNKKKLVEKFQIQLVQNLNPTKPALNRFLKPNDISNLVAQYGTPLYLLDEETLHAKVRELHKAYNKFVGPLKIAYSIKANFSPAVIRAFITDGVTFDLTSIGELHFIKKCRAVSYNAIYISVTEEYEEYLRVLETGIRKVVVGSFNGMTNLAKAAQKVGVKVPTMIRVNPEVGVKAGVRASYRMANLESHSMVEQLIALINLLST